MWIKVTFITAHKEWTLGSFSVVPLLLCFESIHFLCVGICSASRSLCQLSARLVLLALCCCFLEQMKAWQLLSCRKCVSGDSLTNKSVRQPHSTTVSESERRGGKGTNRTHIGQWIQGGNAHWCVIAFFWVTTCSCSLTSPRIALKFYRYSVAAVMIDPFLFVSRWVMMENSDILPFESNQTNCEHLDTAG